MCHVNSWTRYAWWPSVYSTTLYYSFTCTRELAIPHSPVSDCIWHFPKCLTITICLVKTDISWEVWKCPNGFVLQRGKAVENSWFTWKIEVATSCFDLVPLVVGGHWILQLFQMDIQGKTINHYRLLLTSKLKISGEDWNWINEWSLFRKVWVCEIALCGRWRWIFLK